MMQVATVVLTHIVGPWKEHGDLHFLEGEKITRNNVQVAVGLRLDWQEAVTASNCMSHQNHAVYQDDVSLEFPVLGYEYS